MVSLLKYKNVMYLDIYRQKETLGTSSSETICSPKYVKSDYLTLYTFAKFEKKL